MNNHQNEKRIADPHELIEDVEAGSKYMKVYRQMKMYNDVDTNPILYKNK